MPEPKKLKVGLVGLGMMGRNHARVLSSLPGVSFVAAFDELGDPHKSVSPDILCISIDELLYHSLDYCVIAVPTVHHENVALKAASMLSNVLIEKPVAHSIESALRIKEALRNNNLVGAVGQIERYNPSLIKAKQMIQDGDIGKVYQIFTRRQGYFPSRIADVGVVKDLGTHDIDLTAWLVDGSYEKVTAHTAHYSGKNHEDLVTIIGQLSNGTVATHVIDWLSSYKIRKTTIVGEKGCLVADTISATLTFYENASYRDDGFNGTSQGKIIECQVDTREPLLVEHENFRNYVLGISHNVADIDAGIETLRVAEAVLESAKNGVSISLL
jgi:UDP-N-acetylglucosamine 3-dehydrogenase